MALNSLILQPNDDNMNKIHDSSRLGPRYIKQKYITHKHNINATTTPFF